MRILLSSILMLCFLGLRAQETKQHFPDAWIGEWAGELNIYSGQGLAQTLEMELHISAIEKGKWGWTIIYKGDEVDERNYELNIKDASIGHFVIDEQNSILLDAFYLGNTLVSRFSVNNSLLMINYTFESERVVFDVFSGNKETSVVTGEEITQVKEIRSYQMGTRQRAVLLKRE